MKYLFEDIKEKKELLKEKFELSFYVIEKDGKFFGGNSGGSEIWRDDLSLAYHFSEENADDFIKLFPEAQVKKINKSCNNIFSYSFCKFAAGIPLTEEEKKTINIYDELFSKIKKWEEDTSFALKKDLTNNSNLHYYYTLKNLIKRCNRDQVRVTYDIEDNVIDIRFSPDVNKEKAMSDEKYNDVTEVEMKQSDFVCQWVANTNLAKKLKTTVILYNINTGSYYRWENKKQKRLQIDGPRGQAYSK